MVTSIRKACQGSFGFSNLRPALLPPSSPDDWYERLYISKTIRLKRDQKAKYIKKQKESIQMAFEYQTIRQSDKF